MFFISHRGNINGKDIDKENNPDYIKKALLLGYDVEIDVWIKNSMYYLGHDGPQYRIEERFLENKKLWCHAKNNQALARMLKNKKIHCFWHQQDDFTLTSKGYIWTYPGKKLVKGSICVLPEAVNYEKKEIQECIGVCSDYIKNYKSI